MLRISTSSFTFVKYKLVQANHLSAKHNSNLCMGRRLGKKYTFVNHAFELNQTKPYFSQRRAYAPFGKERFCDTCFYQLI